MSIVTGPLAGGAFRELEVETGENIPEGLLESILKRLRRAGAGAPDPTPKYLRAIGGIEAAAPEIVHGAPPKGASAGEVITHAIADGVWRLLRHDPIVRLDTDPEGVHQARVATRRMRSDLRTFHALLDPDWVAELRAELGWLGSELGQARDADVLLDRLGRRAESLPVASGDGAAEVLAGLEQRRAEAHANLLTTLSSERYLSLVDRLIEAGHAPALQGAKAGRPAAKVLAPVVRRAWRALEKHVRGLADQPSDEDLHKLRILAKRCRYAAEACAPSLGKRTHNLARAAADLQDVLGELNDAVVAEQWLRDFAAEGSPTAAFAAGELAILERAAAGAARSSWPTAWARLAKHAPPPA